MQRRIPLYPSGIVPIIQGQESNATLTRRHVVKNPEETALPKARILVIEDDEALARQVKSHLERAGHDVHVENAGRPAIGYANSNRVDLVVLDIRLPDLSGYDVCVELRRLYQPTILPVVILTGLNQPKHQAQGFAHGAEAYLTKPVQTVDLLGTVAVMLHRAGSRKQVA